MGPEEALSTVQQFIDKNLPKDSLSKAQLWALEKPLAVNDVLTSISGPVDFDVNAVDDPPQWAFFLDLDPSANWEHDCAYLVVLESGASVMERRTAPPSTLLTKQLQSVPLRPAEV